MVSAFIDSKRVLDGIKAVSGISDAHLVVAGDGPLRQEARDLAARILPGRYTQVSFPATEMPALYRSADAFMHLSLAESFGNVFLEAWASGIPVVAHDSERLRWIVGDTQFLCDTQSVDSLRDALATALETKKPRSTEGVERFAWPAIAAQYRTAIASAVASR
jgi:glycosyltransferase involved in cell wall biosynthesis